MANEKSIPPAVPESIRPLPYRFSKVLVVLFLALVPTHYAIAQTASEIISPSGGQVILPNFGSVSFPPGAFNVDQLVQISVTSDSDVADTFTQTAVPKFAAGIRLPYELRVNSGPVQPLTSVAVTFTVPDDFRAAIPNDSDGRVFGQNLWRGLNATLDTFEMFPPRFQPADAVVMATLPRSLFTDGRTADGSFEAVITLGTTPTRQSSPLSRAAPTQDDCLGRLLAPPLAQVVVTSKFGERPGVGASDFHYGADLRAARGTAVLAMTSGTVETVARQFNSNGKGWGQYVVIKDDLTSSRTLYAHLELDSPYLFVAQGDPVAVGAPIALSDTSGAQEAHLHIEYAPDGRIFDEVVDPIECLNRDTSLTGEWLGYWEWTSCPPDFQCSIGTPFFNVDMRLVQNGSTVTGSAFSGGSNVLNGTFDGSSFTFSITYAGTLGLIDFCSAQILRNQMTVECTAQYPLGVGSYTMFATKQPPAP